MLISRDTTGEEDSVVLDIVVEKGDQVLNLEGMLWLPLTAAVYPGCKPRSEIACLHVLEAV